MKKKTLFFLCIVLLQFSSVFAVSDTSTDSISYLRIAELEYQNGQLFLVEHVKPVGSKDYEEYKLPLSKRERVQFLRLVKESKLLDIQSNDSKKGTVPFEIEFVKNGQLSKISAYKNGMSEEEEASLDSYLKQIPKIIFRRNHIRTLLASFPDGDYRVKDWKLYSLHIGPKGWRLWEKREGTIIADEPVYVLNGKVTDPEKKELKHISPDDIDSIEIFKEAKKEDLIKTYGEQAKYGVILIKTKKKKFRLFR